MPAQRSSKPKRETRTARGIVVSRAVAEKAADRREQLEAAFETLTGAEVAVTALTDYAQRLSCASVAAALPEILQDLRDAALATVNGAA